MKKVDLIKVVKDNKGKVLATLFVAGGLVALAIVAGNLSKKEQAEAELLVAQETAALEANSVNSDQS